MRAKEPEHRVAIRLQDTYDLQELQERIAGELKRPHSRSIVEDLRALSYLIVQELSAKEWGPVHASALYCQARWGQVCVALVREESRRRRMREGAR